MLYDYNRKAKAFWWVVVLLGGFAIAHSLYVLASLPIGVQITVTLGLVLAALAALFPIDLRSVPTIFASPSEYARVVHLDRKGPARLIYSLGDFYTFLVFFAYGVQPAAITYAIESFIGVRRRSRRLSSWISGPGIAALTLYLCGYPFIYGLPLFDRLTGLSSAHSAAGMALAGLMFAFVYFVVSASLVSAIPLLKRGTRPTLSTFISNIGPTLLSTLVIGVFAGLLVFAFRDDLAVVMLVSAVPIALVTLCLHAFARQQDAYYAAIQTQEARFQSLFNDAAIGMAALSYDGRIQEANVAFGALLGCETDNLARRSFSEFVDAEDADTWSRALRRAEGNHVGKFSLDLRCRKVGGAPMWLTVHVSGLSDSTGAAGLILQAEDSTSRVQTTRELDHLAHHDSLTGLPNRRRFTQLLNDAVATARATPAAGYAVLYLDFDGFKRINDTLGHAAGDRFLVAMAQRIRASVRPMDVVARLGGDEFAVLLPLKMPDEEDEAKAIAERIVQALAAPHLEQGEILCGHASIGIVTSERDYAAEADVMRDADLAMYASKSLNHPLPHAPAR